MTVWDAINDMRKKKEFSFSFMSYDRERRDSKGIVQVRRATLRPKSKQDKVAEADFKLNYLDLDTMEARNCWQVLILEYNGQKLSL